jgi:hypothetical protein
MATNKEIRTAIVDTLSDLVGLNVYGYPVDNVTSPAAVVAGFSTVESTFGGTYNTQAEIYVLVSHRHVDQFEKLDELTDFIGTLSIPQALNERNVANDEMNFATLSVGDFRELIVADVQYYAATVTLRVLH